MPANPLRALTRHLTGRTAEPLPPPEAAAVIEPVSSETSAPPSRTAPRRHVCRIDGDPEAVRTARTFVADVLADADPELTENAVIVTSELVTNALAHGAPPVVLTVFGGPPLVIEVADASPELPAKRLPGEAGHFGMWLAEELAEVTVHPDPHGKIVRATF